MEWIKCSDELPELRDELCLAYSLTGEKYDQHGFPKGGYDCVHIQDYFGDVTNGLDENGDQLYTKMYIHSGITHWMYYPKLPTD